MEFFFFFFLTADNGVFIIIAVDTGPMLRNFLSLVSPKYASLISLRLGSSSKKVRWK